MPRGSPLFIGLSSCDPGLKGHGHRRRSQAGDAVSLTACASQPFVAPAEQRSVRAQPKLDTQTLSLCSLACRSSFRTGTYRLFSLGRRLQVCSGRSHKWRWFTLPDGFGCLIRSLTHRQRQAGSRRTYYSTTGPSLSPGEAGRTEFKRGRIKY